MPGFLAYFAWWLSIHHHAHWAHALLSGQFTPAQYARWFGWAIRHRMPLP